MTRENQSDRNKQPAHQSGNPATSSKDEQQHLSSKPAQSGQPEHVQKSGSPRGFAAMDESRQRDIASAGGKAAHEKGTAHEFDSEEAREAGRKGGEAVSENREHMAEIGRKGGEARQAAAAEARNSNPQGNNQQR